MFPLRVPLPVVRTVVVLPHSHKLSQVAPHVLGCPRGGAEHDGVCSTRGTVRMLEMVCEHGFQSKRKASFCPPTQYEYTPEISRQTVGILEIKGDSGIAI